MIGWDFGLPPLGRKSKMDIQWLKCWTVTENDVFPLLLEPADRQARSPSSLVVTGGQVPEFCGWKCVMLLPVLAHRNFIWSPTRCLYPWADLTAVPRGTLEDVYWWRLNQPLSPNNCMASLCTPTLSHWPLWTSTVLSQRHLEVIYFSSYQYSLQVIPYILGYPLTCINTPMVTESKEWALTAG